MFSFRSSSSLPRLRDIEPVYQGETSECGVACATMLLQALGIDVSLAQLRAHHGAPLLGMSLQDLAGILASHGVATDPVRFAGDALAELPLPAIVHVGGNHFVLAMRAAGDLFQVFDPAMGVNLIPGAVLSDLASGYALILGESVTALPSQRVRRRRRTMSLARAGGAKLAALMATAAALSFLAPLFVGMTVDSALSPTGMATYWQIGLAFLLAQLGAFGFERYSERMLYRRCAAAGALAMSRGFGRLANNRLRYFSRRTPGELVERFMAYGRAALDRLRLDNTMLCAAAIALVSAGIMAWLQPWLAVISLGGIAISGLITQRYMSEAQSLRLESERVAAAQHQFLLETVQGVSAWKAALAVRRRVATHAGQVAAIIANWREVADLDVRKRTTYALLDNLELLVMLGVVAAAMTSGQLTFGGFYAFAFLRQIAIASAARGFDAWVAARANRVAEARAQDIFEQERDACPEQPAQWQAGLSIAGLEFRHESGAAILRDLALDIRRGEKIAVLGPSGSGKTTLMTLLAGMDVPQAGALRIDGAPVPDWHALRRYCYLQTAHDVLFSGSILDNVAMSAPEPNHAACARLLEAIGLGPRIAAMPAGLDTRISDATASLSAGERQRLLVARVLYAARAVGIFDEPTANLDRTSARQVMAAIVAHADAAIVVTHDSAHLDLFDTIYLLHDGKLKRVTRTPVTRTTHTGGAHEAA